MERKVSGIVFYDNLGNILIQDRRKMSKWGEEYGFFGGAIEKGETPEQALKREVKEELSIKIKDYRLFKHQKRFVKEADINLDLYLFIAPIPDLKTVLVKEGKMSLVTFDRAFKLKWLSGDVELLKEIYDYLKKEHRIT